MPMAKARDSDMWRPKSGKRWRLTILILVGAAGFAYVGSHDIDWPQRLAALREWFSQTPLPKQSQKPLQPSSMPPKFDVAYVDEAGRLVAAGQGEAGWTVRLMTESHALGETKVDDNYEWVLIPEERLAPGEHSLRLVEIDPVSLRSIAGLRTITVSIAPRQEATRQPNRGAPMPAADHAVPLVAQPASQPDSERKDCDVATVKRGDTLWALAHHCYGDGARYSKIFDSNREQLQNPDLIYPEQKLTLPH